MDKKMKEILSSEIESKKYIGLAILVSALISFIVVTNAFAAENFNENIPAKGMVTMVDLGAGYCTPCKMMAPILEKMEKKYAGKAVIHFYDLREDRDAFEHYRVQVMPTQIFFDKKGKEVYRHLGFMSEADIIQQFDKMGVK